MTKCPHLVYESAKEFLGNNITLQHKSINIGILYQNKCKCRTIMTGMSGNKHEDFLRLPLLIVHLHGRQYSLVNTMVLGFIDKFSGLKLLFFPTYSLFSHVAICCE